MINLADGAPKEVLSDMEISRQLLNRRVSPDRWRTTKRAHVYPLDAVRFFAALKRPDRCLGRSRRGPAACSVALRPSG